MREVDPIYRPNEEGIWERFADWLLANNLNGLSLAGWSLEIDPNTEHISWNREIYGKEGWIIASANPWVDGEDIQVVLSRLFKDCKDDSGEGIFRKTYPLRQTGNFRRDYENYIQLLQRQVFPEVDRAFDELGDQPAMTWSKERSSAWHKFVGSLKIGDKVKFSAPRRPDGAAGLKPDNSLTLTADDILDLYAKAKREPDQAKREQMMKQVQAASQQFDDKLLGGN